MEKATNSGHYKTALSNSIELAELRGVPESEALHSLSDIDSFFRGDFNGKN